MNKDPATTASLAVTSMFATFAPFQYCCPPSSSLQLPSERNGCAKVLPCSQSDSSNASVCSKEEDRTESDSCQDENDEEPSDKGLLQTAKESDANSWFREINEAPLPRRKTAMEFTKVEHDLLAVQRGFLQAMLREAAHEDDLKRKKRGRNSSDKEQDCENENHRPKKRRRRRQRTRHELTVELSPEGHHELWMAKIVTPRQSVTEPPSKKGTASMKFSGATSLPPTHHSSALVNEPEQVCSAEKCS